MSLFTVNTYCGDIDKIQPYISLIQSTLNNRTIEWHRAKCNPSAIFNISNSNILFVTKHINYYKDNLYPDMNTLLCPNTDIRFISTIFVSYVHLYITSCIDSDQYDDIVKNDIRKWLNIIKSIDEEAEFYIVQLLIQDTPISMKTFFSRSVNERMKKEFILNEHSHFIQLSLNPKKNIVINVIIDELVSSHRINAFYSISKIEVEFFKRWNEINNNKYWSLSYNLSISYKLFKIYNQIMFYDEICEIYSTIYCSLFENIKNRSINDLPLELQESYRVTKLLITRIKDNEINSLSEFSNEIFSTVINPNESDYLKGYITKPTLINILLHGIGVNIYCSNWYKNYRMIFRQVCEFIMEYKIILYKMEPEIEERKICYINIELVKWFLNLFNNLMNESKLVENNVNESHKFSTGIYNLLSLICQILKKYIDILSKHNKLNDNIHLSLSEEILNDFYTLPNSSNMRSMNKGPMWNSVMNIRDDKLIDDTLYIMDKIPKININKDNSKRVLYESVNEFKDNISINMKIDRIKENEKVCQNSELSLISVFGNNNSDENSKICMKKVIDIFNILSQETDDNNMMKEKLYNICLITYYNTSILLEESKCNRMSSIFIYETGRVFWELRYNYHALTYYSNIILYSEIYKWKNIWYKILMNTFEILCNLKACYSKVNILEKIENEKISKNVYKKLKEAIIKDKLCKEVLCTLLYLSCSIYKNLVKKNIILIEYFELLLDDIVIENNIEILANPILEIIENNMLKKRKISSVSKSVIELKVISHVPKSIKLSKIYMYFKELINISNNQTFISTSSSSSTDNVNNESSIGNNDGGSYDGNEEEVKSTVEPSYIIYEMEEDEYELKNGVNIIRLYCNKLYTSRFKCEKIEYYYKKCKLITYLEEYNNMYIDTVFMPPIFYMKNVAHIIRGLMNRIEIVVKNKECDLIQNENLIIKLECDGDIIIKENSTNEYRIMKKNDEYFVQILNKMIKNSEMSIYLDIEIESFNENKRMIYVICESKNKIEKYIIPIYEEKIFNIKYKIWKSSKNVYIQLLIQNIGNVEIFIKNLVMISLNYILILKYMNYVEIVRLISKDQYSYIFMITNSDILSLQANSYDVHLSFDLYTNNENINGKYNYSTILNIVIN